jgi:regulator of RNase E activity RraA
MFVLNALPPPVDPALLDLLRRAEPATIGHVRHTGFMDPAIRGLLPDRRIAGTAVTCRCVGPDTTIVHYALGQLRPGDILVIDRAGDHRHAACGGGVAFAAREAGCIGIIIDGVATDIGELRDYGVPVWARGLSAVTGKRSYTQGEFCVPVSCGGVAVEPGDAILADENGVLVLKAHEITAAAERAIAMQDAEKKTLARISAGERMPDINGTNARLREIMAATKA